ncbi:hypothetical protein EGW08_018978 [Elysia chlorotica]|uniref:Eukaryotic translation initiation factor 2-alpha kinase 1 n=1 Tax=Elysia chlorotica TaxID=188477 RepID=A0A433SVI5_ELYCH|nr:hypothetical protein EGW08_018978 [Elysia chlorotica]
MASNQRNPTRKSAPRTVKDFARRKMPIRQFDTSDLQQLQLPQIEVSVVRSDANHLLMTSLLEQLCNMYVADRSVARQLFKNLCEQLGKLNIIAPLTMLDEMSGLRNQHRAMFNKIMQAAIKSLKQPLPALPENDITRIRLAPAEDDIIGEHTSRYKNEFREIEPLGKGGFGTVYKAENYLDGRQYAVKKIRFKHKHTHKLIKLLREVKALANLQHSNIVGYNAAWMEYDSPFCSSNCENLTFFYNRFYVNQLVFLNPTSVVRSSI